MAFFNKLTIAVAAFSVLSAARPLAVNLPRDVVMVTETEYTTIDVPVTLWVDKDGKPLATVAPDNFGAGRPSQVSATSSSDSNKIIQSASITSSSSPTSIPVVVPTTTPAPQLVTTQAPTTQAVATTAAPVVPAVNTPQQTTAAPAQSAAPQLSSPQSNNQSGQTGLVTGTSSAMCKGAGDACSGDITHWDGGLGACGWNVDTATELQVSLPVGLMGTLSNSNPMCGQMVTIQNPTTGAQVVAKVGDKCMGCTGRSIDLTDALFKAVGGGCDGRCPGFVWWFNN